MKLESGLCIQNNIIIFEQDANALNRQYELKNNWEIDHGVIINNINDNDNNNENKIDNIQKENNYMSNNDNINSENNNINKDDYKKNKNDIFIKIEKNDCEIENDENDIKINKKYLMSLQETKTIM